MSDLAVYQEEQEHIARMRETLCKLMPGGTRFTLDEAESVARVAVMHGLDPFNGEVWGLKGKDRTGNDKWYGVMVGIKGLRKHARNQMSKSDGAYWGNFVKVDPTKYNANKNDIVYEYHMYDTHTTQAYTHAVSDLRKAGVPYEDVVNMLGRSPKTVGVGIFVAGERTKLKPDAAAKKRAEADAIRQRFDVQWAQIDALDTHTPEGIEDEWYDAPVITERSEPVDEYQLRADLGFEIEDAEPILDIEDAEPELIEDDSEYNTLQTPKGTPYFMLDEQQLMTVIDALQPKVDAMRAEGVNDDNADICMMYQFQLEGAKYYLEKLTDER